jgi:uncharacterized protein (TIGR00299 family) protein
LSKAICFDPATGAAGDMILGALMDLGTPLEVIDSGIRSTGLNEFELKFNRITDKFGLTAGRAEVITGESHHHRKLTDIETIIGAGRISDNARNMALRIFHRLAEAEATVHNVSINEIHFHEVGAVDAIVDILGTALAIDYLHPEHIFCGPLKTGRGSVECAHGIIPVPAPATVELLKGFPVIPLDIHGELTTPTGAAILTTLSEGDFSGRAMSINKIGYGLGSRQFDDRSNVIRIFEAELIDNKPPEEVEIIETDIDDDSPEITGSLNDILRVDGVYDITMQPLIMKKGRPGQRLTVIADRGRAEQIADLIFKHSSTIGLRIYNAHRIILPRETVEINTRWGIISAKKIRRPDRIEIVPEYEECRMVAEKESISIREVMQEVIRNAR